MTIFQASNQNERIGKALQLTVFAYVLVGFIAWILYAFFAASWWNTPFIGAFTEHSMLFNGVGVHREDGSWQLFNDGVVLNYHLEQIDGRDVRSSKEVRDVLSAFSVGDTVSITYTDPDGNPVSREIVLEKFSNTDRINYYFLPNFIGLIYLVIGAWIFKLRRTESAGRAFTIFATSLAIGASGLFDIYTTHYLTYLWTFAIALAGGAFFDLALSFPQEFNFTRNRPYIRWIGYAIAVFLGILTIPSIYNIETPALYVRRWQAIYGFTGINILLFLLVLFMRSYTDKSPVSKQQVRMVWLGIAFAFAPVGVFMFISFIKPMNFNPLLFLPTIHSRSQRDTPSCVIVCSKRITSLAAPFSSSC
ncbi:MAG: hypothetical protein L3J16_01125 [Anaerolineales bacterium]|nr:hypothetical protein [Anaerolineales bacterium]